VTVKAQLGEVMAERAGLQKELLAVREALRASEEEGKRLDRDASVLKGQVTALTEQLQARNLEVKALASKQKDLQEEIVRQQALLQESHEEAVNDLNNRIKEIKRAEEVKNTNNLKLIAKK
jgi:chromosome segregation ATPase